MNTIATRYVPPKVSTERAVAYRQSGRMRGADGLVTADQLGDHRVCHSVGEDGSMQCYADIGFIGVSKCGTTSFSK
jgi:hypothetical protein